MEGDRLELDNEALLTVYTSSYTPSHETWGFSYRPHQHELLIAASTDMVVTHGPPHGIMDTNAARQRAGCPNLLPVVTPAQPKLHCFGHLHEGWGARLVTWRPDPSATPSALRRY